MYIVGGGAGRLSIPLTCYLGFETFAGDYFPAPNNIVFCVGGSKELAVLYESYSTAIP